MQNPKVPKSLLRLDRPVRSSAGAVESGVVVVGTAVEGKTSVIVAVTTDLATRLPASQIASRVGKALGGSGGGKPDLAQAGGKNPELLGAGLKAAAVAVRDLLAEPAA